MAIGKTNGGNGRGGGRPKKANGKDPTIRELVETLVVDVRAIKSDVGNLKKAVSHLRRTFDERLTSLETRMTSVEGRMEKTETALGLRTKE